MPRTRPTYLYAIVSVALVLYILGFFGLLTVYGRQLVALYKERIDIWLELKGKVPEQEINRLVRQVRAEPFVLPESVTFITKEQAKAAMKEDLGDASMLDDIPNLMCDVIQFNVKAAFMQEDSLRGWREQLRQDTVIAELYFEVANTSNISKNIQSLGWISLALGLMLIFAAVTLIHNTIRLALYSNRFVVKNQELVGASWEFITRPYLQRGILNGFWSALIAIFALIASIWAMTQLMPDLEQVEDLNGVLVLFVLLTLLGVLLSGLSTWFVVNKFLRMRIDDLY
jgi:cell division transport system permease protein